MAKSPEINKEGIRTLKGSLLEMEIACRSASVPLTGDGSAESPKQHYLRRIAGPIIADALQKTSEEMSFLPLLRRDDLKSIIEVAITDALQGYFENVPDTKQRADSNGIHQLSATTFVAIPELLASPSPVPIAVRHTFKEHSDKILQIFDRISDQQQRGPSLNAG